MRCNERFCWHGAQINGCSAFDFDVDDGRIIDVRRENALLEGRAAILSSEDVVTEVLSTAHTDRVGLSG
jgi:hypothetical protein